MGEASELITEGLLCQVCHVLMDDEEAPGYPRTCEECQFDQNVAPSR